tara:strand:+ start:430 stop:618 length:189 start_codon:yes stop_codon:yes gene_type:complete
MDIPKYFVANPIFIGIDIKTMGPKDECQRKYELTLAKMREKILFLKFIRERLHFSKSASKLS